VVTELIQNEMNAEKLNIEFLRLCNGDIRKQMEADYKILKEKLGNAGASKRTAALMFNFVSPSK
jgi:lipid-A-disaccharide synthase